MHKLVSFVFKFLMMSLILMFVLDTTLVVAETISIHSKVNTLASLMQGEIARNNCMPSALADTFAKELNKIVEDSPVAKNKIDTNMEEDLTEDKALDYGNIATLVITVHMNPSMVYFNTGGSIEASENKAGGNSLLEESPYEYDLTYTYKIPCLRYLK